MKKNEKNDHSLKTPLGSFESEDKESFKARLKALLRGRSINQAAKEWGVNVSTLKNYFSRQNSTPRHEVLAKITRYERVSVNWLLYGDLIESENESVDSLGRHSSLSDEVIKLASVLDFLNKRDIENLSKILILKGVETLLYLLDEDNIRLLQLDRVVKAKLLGMQSNAAAALNDERVKECGSDSEGEAASPSLTGGRKQAV